ncbi:ankyrin repeat-containing protein [Aspergillus flavus]|nr:ankyrin repeat-containing protein [Aspergillus flavus]RAQ77734.1 ankyrin repeat-containing protein [Aspergillus flavus]
MDSSRHSPYSGTALQRAVAGGHVEAARLLLEYGADVNAAPARVKSPLHLACRNGDVIMARMLLDARANFRAVSYSGKTVRRSAEKGGSVEILQLLNMREALEPSDGNKTEILDVSTIAKRGLCSTCSGLPLEVFTSPRWLRRYHSNAFCFHPSLVSLEKSARGGCPFCLFFWKRLGINIISIPQPSKVRLFYGRRSTDDVAKMLSQIDEPYPKDIERPRSERADFQACVEPFDGKVKALPGNTQSAETYQQIVTWLQQCIKDHHACTVGSNGRFLPTRLIDLTDWGRGKVVKLVESNSIHRDQSIPYIALSHRWDGQITAAASTTSDNFIPRLKELTLDTLPRNFVHAMEVTHQLKINYLWVDSLCILQDSKRGLESRSSPDERCALDAHEVYTSWLNTVRDYASRSLTKYEDTFPALSGLARIVHGYIHCDYVAGMWAADLRRSIAWEPGEDPNADSSASRHATYVAPSWSWASVIGTINFEEAKTLSRDISDETAAVIDGWRITHLTQDPFGQIATAELHITAPVLTAVLDYHSASSDYYLRGPHDTGVVWCIPLFTSDVRGGIGLALVPVQGQEHTYRRVGHIWELGMSHFQALERQSIVLI